MTEKNNQDMVQTQTILSLNDDFALIRAFNSGDEASFRLLVNRHKEKVRNLIYLTLGNTDNVDDISQEVFISVYRKLSTFRYESQFTTWLYTITLNKCRDQLRKNKIRRIFSSLSFTEDDPQIPAEASPDDKDIQVIVRKAVARLPEKLRVPLVLKDFDGLSYQEIAEITGAEMGTVKSRLFRAREALKDILLPLKKELI